MFSLPIALQRKRRLVSRLAGLLVLAAVGFLATLPLPKADAAGPATVAAPASDPMGLLLSPEPVSSARFSATYAITAGNI